jgi:hypothetical protein
MAAGMGMIDLNPLDSNLKRVGNTVLFAIGFAVGAGIMRITGDPSISATTNDSQDGLTAVLAIYDKIVKGTPAPPIVTDPGKLWTSKESWTKAGISQREFRRHEKAGKVKRCRKGKHGLHYFTGAEIDRWIRAEGFLTTSDNN